MEIPFKPSQVLLNQQTVASIIGHAIEDTFLAFEDEEWCLIPERSRDGSECFSYCEP
jgi:hypothetical protein